MGAVTDREAGNRDTSRRHGNSACRVGIMVRSKRYDLRWTGLTSVIRGTNRQDARNGRIDHGGNTERLVCLRR